MNSCSKKNDSSHNTTSLNFTIPAGFPDPQYKFEGNTLTKEGFELGRTLFYDGILSKDGNFSCASCHQQFAAFSTFDHDLSHGFNNQFTTRNAPALFNLVWQKEYHWDGGINHIEVQPLAPLTAPNEMAEDINNVVDKLKKDDNYKKMFRAAYGDDAVSSQRMLKAITQFVGSLVSANSKYDKVKRGEKSFTVAEQTGYTAFQQKCASCHKEPLFTDLSYRNNGMPLNTYLNDYGRMRITGKKEDSLKFKVPSLRNVFQSFPYGHDGRFYSIDNVLNHYSTGIKSSPTLDPLLKNKIPLTTEERYYIKIFLATLTDSTFLNDKRFAQP
ncbi:MAG: cytochrome-c peroxidase [Chitinophagaceae bacterium]